MKNSSGNLRMYRQLFLRQICLLTQRLIQLFFSLPLIHGKRFIPEQFPIIMIAFYGEDFRKVITWKRFKTEEDYMEFVDLYGI